MPSTHRQSLIRSILCLALLGSTARAAGENIALHRPYTFSTAPNYSLCTDPCDITQLTDGELSGGHTTTECVGWSARGPVSITIDLGTFAPIEGFGLKVGGAYTRPAFVHMWVSTDGNTFSYAGELLSTTWDDGLPEGGNLRGQSGGVPFYQDHSQMHAGRYVKFTLFGGSGYIFTDELEVYAGGFDPYSVTPSATQLTADFETWAYDNKADGIAHLRMLYDLQELEKHPQAAAFASQINAVRSSVLAMPWVSSLTYENGLPYNSIHADIFSLNGDMNRAAGLDEFSIAAADAYQPLHPFDTFTPVSGTTTLEMLGNETRSLAFNVSNFSNDTTTFDVTLTWPAQRSPRPCVRSASPRSRNAPLSVRPCRSSRPLRPITGP